ncbi:metallophosphoesterase [Mycoplasma sp. Ms02]|uniref:metallophosphoesterase family protein n=1 Tax=Mycoplasma sp. Ms02 TaxID=353851 RepID=UPI001C8981A2|nr:YfcE family phosphodiesterase [Mycoplasma sp. Ms02]QZE12271.1 YfcE family phosphodiesterase [Mycoplasma sp. Ms02]
MVLKFLLMSDVHGNKEKAKEILKSEDYDFSVSLGDTELIDDWVTRNFSYAVAGNNDWNSSLKYEYKFEIMNTKFFIAHGHTIGYGGYDTLLNAQKIDKATKYIDFDFMFSGHTHVPNFFKNEDQTKIFINPGSITYPRMNSPHSYCVATINTETKELLNLEFKRC